MLDTKKCRNLAEREGFEPSVPVTQYARLAILTGGFTACERLRPKRKNFLVGRATSGALCVPLG